MSFDIRHYRQADRDGLLKIAADTAFFGVPIEHEMDDRRLFLDGFYAYYLDYESEHAWVADRGGEVIGFLTGCLDSRRHEHCWRRRLLPASAGRVIRGRYHLGRRTWQYLGGLLGDLLRQRLPAVNLERYPAHFHLNIAEQWRGQGLGEGLLVTFLGYLIQSGVPGVHLHTTSYNHAACKLYEKTGFQLLDQRPARMWRRVIPEPIYHRAYGKILD